MTTATAPLQGVVVLDTNVVLDWVIFQDPAVTAWVHAITQGQVRWVATAHMQAEALRVLHYPGMQARIPNDTQRRQFVQETFERYCMVLTQEQQHALDAFIGRLNNAPIKLRCSDPDDQCFLDLAQWLMTQPQLQPSAPTHVTLVSKDNAVLKQRKRAAKLGITISKPCIAT